MKNPLENFRSHGGRAEAGRLGKIILYMLVDAACINLSIAIAVGLWFGGSIPGSKTTYVPDEAWAWFWRMAVAAPIICFVVYFAFRLYSSLWKYANIDELFKIFLATFISFVLIYLYGFWFASGGSEMLRSRRLMFLAWVLDFMLFVSSRLGYRGLMRSFVFVSHMASSRAGLKRVMVIGAGFAGYGVVRGILGAPVRDRLPVLIVDGDSEKNNAYILGVRVVSGLDRIPEYAVKFQIDEIIVALPNADPREQQEVYRRCASTDCRIKIIPSISDITEGVPSPRDINISDLLFRDEVVLDTKNISDYLSKRTVLVTGGGGSIGSELCRQIAKFAPAGIIIFDIYENHAYELANELLARNPGINVMVKIGSVRDPGRLDEIFSQYMPQVIFHAAAHKHVPLMEDCPGEAVKNNIFGTLNVVKCADKYGAERFVMLSTDKAVNPASVMGATKRVTELIVQDQAARSKTKYMIVRFGNVLGSRGSVIPKFQEQIAWGGPVTITHPDMERYFMTIPEAARLVLQAAGLGKSGNIFVLDMGEPVKIVELAKNLIKLSGYQPDKDIKIEYTGLRPGEKLHEELIMEEERGQMQVTCHKKIFMARPTNFDSRQLERHLRELSRLSQQSSGDVVAYLQEMLQGFNPHSGDTRMTM